MVRHSQRRFEESNAARMSAAGDGLTEPILYFRNAKMQTNLLGSTNEKTTPQGVVFLLVWHSQRRFEESNAARMSAAGNGLTEPNLYFRNSKMQTNLLGSTPKATPL